MSCSAVLPDSCSKGLSLAVTGAFCEEDPFQGWVSSCHRHNFQGPGGPEDKEHSTHTANGQTFQRGGHLQLSDLHRSRALFTLETQRKSGWDGGERIRRLEGGICTGAKGLEERRESGGEKSLLWTCTSTSLSSHGSGV